MTSRDDPVDLSSNDEVILISSDDESPEILLSNREENDRHRRQMAIGNNGRGNDGGRQKRIPMVPRREYFENSLGSPFFDLAFRQSHFSPVSPGVQERRSQYEENTTHNEQLPARAVVQNPPTVPTTETEVITIDSDVDDFIESDDDFIDSDDEEMQVEDVPRHSSWLTDIRKKDMELKETKEQLKQYKTLYKAMKEKRDTERPDGAVTTPTCAICTNEYGHVEDRTPRILECGHTICLSCANSMYKDGRIKCPYDRKTIKLFGTPASKLVKNLALLDMCP